MAVLSRVLMVGVDLATIILRRLVEEEETKEGEGGGGDCTIEY